MCFETSAVDRASKCPKFYTNSILGEQNLRQRVCKFFENFNCDQYSTVFNIRLKKTAT